MYPSLSVFDKIIEGRSLKVDYLTSPHNHTHTGINVCALTLLDFHQQIGTLVLFHAKELIGIFDDCLLDVQKRMVKQSRLLGDLGVGDSSSSSDDDDEESNSFRPNYTVKNLCHIRLSNLPRIVRRNISRYVVMIMVCLFRSAEQRFVQVQ